MCVVGAGAECVGDLVPGAAVGSGVIHELRQAPLGLLDEAGNQGHHGDVVAEPEPAALDEGDQGIVDEVHRRSRRMRSWPR